MANIEHAYRKLKCIFYILLIQLKINNILHSKFVFSDFSTTTNFKLMTEFLYFIIHAL